MVFVASQRRLLCVLFQVQQLSVDEGLGTSFRGMFEQHMELKYWKVHKDYWRFIVIFALYRFIQCVRKVAVHF
jgi:hypothetical protein